MPQPTVSDKICRERHTAQGDRISVLEEHMPIIIKKLTEMAGDIGYIKGLLNGKNKNIDGEKA